MRIVLLFFVIVYAALFYFSFTTLSHYEDIYTPAQGALYSLDAMTTRQTVAWVIWEYVLKFPLGIWTWFMDGYFRWTWYLWLPNALLMGLLYDRMVLRK